VAAISWDDAARICRRICVLRERGETEAAEKLTRGALAEAMAAIRTISGEAEAVVAARVEAMFEAEQERVANAAVLADLLAPLLRDELSSAVATVPTPSGAGANPGNPRTHSRAEPRPPATGIADFIDEMIAQERSAPPRRAS
jgi:hypothetical protein